jgi:hypothetical protein
MLLFIATLVAFTILVVVSAITLLLGGSMFLLVFGDALVCIGLYWLIFRGLFKKK